MAFTTCAEGRLAIVRTRLVASEGRLGSPGEVVRADRKGISVACGEGAIEVLEAQREGKKVCCAPDLVSGRAVGLCEVFGACTEPEP
jgi:methionyl-tRNA formyltransferase